METGDDYDNRSTLSSIASAVAQRIATMAGFGSPAKGTSPGRQPDTKRRRLDAEGDEAGSNASA